MTATDELRKMLDERGVKWNATTGAMGTIWTHWDTFNGHRVHAMDNEDGTVKIFGEWDVTPEQAIAATLGVGTCHITRKFTCSECGHQYPTRNYESYETCDGRTAFAPLGYNVLDCKKPNYCPNCGREVD